MDPIMIIAGGLIGSKVLEMGFAKVEGPTYQVCNDTGTICRHVKGRDVQKTLAELQAMQTVPVTIDSNKVAMVREDWGR